MNYLTAALGLEEATLVFGRISNALKAYGESHSPSARLVKRSYRREFGSSPRKTDHLVLRGLYQPGSLHAVLRTILREYESEPMRVYAVAEIFGLARYQARVVLDLIRR